MKKIIAMILAAMLLLMTLTGCDSDESNEPKGPEKHSNEDVLGTNDIPEEPEVSPNETNLATERITIQLETGEVSISLPIGWEVVRDGRTGIPFTSQTYDIRLVPPSNEKAMGIITIGATVGGQPLSAEDFSSLYTDRSEILLPRAVEDVAEYTDVMVNDGYAIYTVLTDASLVGATLQEDEYLFLAVFHANYNSGYLTYASLFTDDLDSESFQIMLNAVASIEASFDDLPHSLGLDGWEAIKSAPVYDLDDFDLLDHDLSSSEYLTEYMLESEQLGKSLRITVHTAGQEFIRNGQEPDSIIWHTEGVGMLYYILPSLSIIKNLDTNVTSDIRRMETDGFTLSAFLPLRVSENGQSAAFGLNADLYGKPDVIYLYLLQDIPDTDYTLLLVIMFFHGYLNDNDFAVIDELSEHIGIDIGAYIPW